MVTDAETDSADAVDHWQKIATHMSIATIPPGEARAWTVDATNGTIATDPLIDPQTGLSPTAENALDRVPGWIHDALCDQFSRLASVPVATDGNTAPTAGDLDADGDLDIVMGTANGSVLALDNIGTTMRAVFQRSDRLEMVNDYCRPRYANTHPALADLDADGDLDLVIGTADGTLRLFWNTKPPTNWSLDIDTFAGVRVDADAAVTLADLDNDGDLDLTLGAADGTLRYYENVGSAAAPAWQRRPMLLASIDVGEKSAPTWCDLDADGDLDLTLGSQSGLIHYYENIGTATAPILAADDLTAYSAIQPQPESVPAFADMDADGRVSLLIGTRTGAVLALANRGSATAPQWVYWPGYSYTPHATYYPPYGTLHERRFFDLDRYAREILACEEELVDEVAFAVAHTPVAALRENPHPSLMTENAALVYQQAKELSYVRIIDMDDRSTTVYRVRDGATVSEVTLPAIIYYWYIVMPKITDEQPGYIDPDSGARTAPDAGGRFWREYLYYHNDSAYPADRDPSDDLDQYPTDRAPPLLRDLLIDVDYLWNRTPFVAPGGRDAHYGDHALIRVSNWVAKTLILNQQEVSDDERPIQPVRIAHHHNGNCGELQDLTVAAARTALIPAAGVLLLGEDHVWIEFYEGGWHQWDNYWSDSGSVIDRADTYWQGWGERGGSGITRWRSDDRTTEVTPRYVPANNLSTITIRVLDRNRVPVDGARVGRRRT